MEFVLSMLSLRLLPILAIFVACSPQEQPFSSRSAQFGEYPKRLFDTFKVSCDGPGENFAQVSAGVFECRETLPPDATAFLILNYDGFPQKLPQSVRRMSSEKNSQGYRVDADLYFLIPQQNGSTVKVPVESEALDQELTSLFRFFGGTPVVKG